jgi:hypothetical protein
VKDASQYTERELLLLVKDDWEKEEDYHPSKATMLSIINERIEKERAERVAKEKPTLFKPLGEVGSGGTVMVGAMPETSREPLEGLEYATYMMYRLHPDIDHWEFTGAAHRQLIVYWKNGNIARYDAQTEEQALMAIENIKMQPVDGGRLNR